QHVRYTAEQLINAVRGTNNDTDHFRALLTEYDLSNAEGGALMCSAEAILRIPDKTTIERLITDKISHADWAHHLGRNKSKFVNSTTWSLLLTGKILNLSGVLPNLLKRCGEPIVRQAVTQAVKMLCKQFVLGQNIDEALQVAAGMPDYLFSFDMLGEEARTTADAHRYFESYMQAIEVIARSGQQNDVHTGPGISVKLSALHPRFEWRKHARVMRELMPRLIELTLLAKQYNIGVTIDAEEAERLDLTLDIFTELCNDPRFAEWPGLGIAVQAYQKRAPYVIDYLVDLARTTHRRINVRLVKGAYWDTEIKLAQEKGLSGYPVFTRKAATDVTFIACVKQMLAAKDAIYSQFATHNAYSVAVVLELAKDYNDFEFQALYGMGAELYAHVKQKYNIPCRIYAPVGAYHYLFGYLVRRLLENGANSSFVNRVLDEDASISELVQDPYELVEDAASIENPKIPLPIDLFGDTRPNSQGIDFTNPLEYLPVLEVLQAQAKSFKAKPPIHTTAEQLERMLALAKRATNIWGQTDPGERIACIQRMAHLLEKHKAELLALLVLEGHKTILDALAEVREAIDYCWYYSYRANIDLSVQVLDGPTGELNELQLLPRGTIACISPWNFPLAIFLGQIIAALVTGNTVIAKPARQTTRIATRAIELLHDAGIPKEVVHMVIGTGAEVGDPLVQDLRVNGVMLTGSIDTAWRINKNLALREGAIVPFIAETGGQNAMLVDSSALPEQVVSDVITSAFGNAGQRCSCLRVLYLQEDVADVIIDMLCGAMAELSVADPMSLETDIGPVIDQEAYDQLQEHSQKLRQTAKLLYEVPLATELHQQNYFPPTAFEIQSITQLEGEVFGPILHVIRYPATQLGHILNEINATGYGLTLGIHSRIDDTVEFIVNHVKVGNVYVNRNMIGAVVGVQPFGGEGLSGTGPKAGGPYYLPRLTVERTMCINTAAIGGNATLLNLGDE
ncbi:MAG TPA: bifunctional proline dehydrogenase/L-glutamate gamma-semialdehyde dehydrogenase PutA, partial [Gammaproteobacteria bacterium]|nr:bifunctional proline dehydrogenase/L-glutamate gamma-semialdehyde dehydrogenase PutA [Gammaproteobacteria bacterium]